MLRHHVAPQVQRHARVGLSTVFIRYADACELARTDERPPALVHRQVREADQPSMTHRQFVAGSSKL